MLAVSMLFDAIAREVYDTRFQWSDYNRAQWDKFVNLEIGGDGGSCAFSLVARDETMGHVSVHEGARALKVRALARWLVFQKRANPLFVDVGAPFGAEQVHHGQLQQEVPEGLEPPTLWSEVRPSG